MDRDDVRVVEGGDRSRFAAKSLEPLGVGGDIRRQHLQGHVAAERSVRGAIHGAHRARSQMRNDGVVPERVPRLHRRVIVFGSSQRVLGSGV
jgi:hypothetical protein